MIRIEKAEKPKVLEDNAVAWAQEYLGMLEAGVAVPDRVRFRYRHSDIKTTLRSESSDKCIYCESKISHVFPGETDHLAPVSERPDLYVTWENLGYVCKDCNQWKGAYYDEDEPLIDPFSVDPSEHLAFFGPVVFQQPGDLLGFRTIHRLKLCRGALLERRREMLEGLQVMIDQWSNMPEGPTRDLFKSQVVEQADRTHEYSAAAKAFLHQSCDW